MGRKRAPAGIYMVDRNLKKPAFDPYQLSAIDSVLKVECADSTRVVLRLRRAWSQSAHLLAILMLSGPVFGSLGLLSSSRSPSRVAGYELWFLTVLVVGIASVWCSSVRRTISLEAGCNVAEITTRTGSAAKLPITGIGMDRGRLWLDLGGARLFPPARWVVPYANAAACFQALRDALRPGAASAAATEHELHGSWLRDLDLVCLARDRVRLRGYRRSLALLIALAAGPMLLASGALMACFMEGEGHLEHAAAGRLWAMWSAASLLSACAFLWLITTQAVAEITVFPGRTVIVRGRWSKREYPAHRCQIDLVEKYHGEDGQPQLAVLLLRFPGGQLTLRSARRSPQLAATANTLAAYVSGREEEESRQRM